MPKDLKVGHLARKTSVKTLLKRIRGQVRIPGRTGRKGRGGLCKKTGQGEKCLSWGTSMWQHGDPGQGLPVRTRQGRETFWGKMGKDRGGKKKGRSTRGRGKNTGRKDAGRQELGSRRCLMEGQALQFGGENSAKSKEKKLNDNRRGWKRNR